ncbi:hypothetical protein LJC74_08300 [Eubacteriales bacterium OttesenSCG-928-A19]|nr:hypothetical protein [Eubacteriales bacterium OttesenSCG-928-A19]
MKKMTLTVALLLVALMAVAACAQATEESVPESFIPTVYIINNDPPEVTDPDTDSDVQGEITTLEARRTYHGEISLEKYGADAPLKWNCGIAYTDDAKHLGELKQVNITSDSDKVVLVDQKHAYSLSEDATSATLTLTYTVRLNNQYDMYREDVKFILYPEGEGLRVVSAEEE